MGSALAPELRFPSLASLLLPANVYFYLNFYYFYNLYNFYCQKNYRDHLSFLLAQIPNLDVSVSAGGVGRIKVTVVGIINWRINISRPPANYLNPANYHLVSQSWKWQAKNLRIWGCIVYQKIPKKSTLKKFPTKKSTKNHSNLKEVGPTLVGIWRLLRQAAELVRERAVNKSEYITSKIDFLSGAATLSNTNSQIGLS